MRIYLDNRECHILRRSLIIYSRFNVAYQKEIDNLIQKINTCQALQKSGKGFDKNVIQRPND